MATGTPSVPPRPGFHFPIGTLAFPSGTAQSVATAAEAAPLSNGELPGGYTQAQIAEMINNPPANLWLLFLQNDAVWYDGDALDLIGEDQKVFNTTVLQPVFSTQSQNWRWIFRPVIPSRASICRTASRCRRTTSGAPSVSILISGRSKGTHTFSRFPLE